MMFGWTKSKRETGEKQRRSLRPARLGLLVFALICAGIAYWDISANGATGGLTLEQPAVDVNALPHAAREETEQDGEQGRETEDAEALFAAYRQIGRAHV